MAETKESKKTNRKRGAPALFKTPGELEAKIDGYFEKCKGRILTITNAKGEEVPFISKRGNVVYVDATMPTISGLAYYLGFSSRQSLWDYKQREEYADIINRATLCITSAIEERLFDRDGARGAELWLKVHDKWVASETEQKLDIDRAALKLNEDKMSGVSKSAEAINSDLLNLFSMLKTPCPDRRIEDFEERE